MPHTCHTRRNSVGNRGHSRARSSLCSAADAKIRVEPLSPRLRRGERTIFRDITAQLSGNRRRRRHHRCARSHGARRRGEHGEQGPRRGRHRLRTRPNRARKSRQAWRHCATCVPRSGVGKGQPLSPMTTATINAQACLLDRWRESFHWFQGELFSLIVTFTS